MTKNWYWRIGLVWCLSVFLVGCKGDSGPKVLKLAHSLDNTHPVHKALEFMAQKAAEKSGGRLRIDIYPSGQLGSEREAIEQLQIGALAMTKTSTGPLESFIPEMKVLGMPYLFRDQDHKRKVFKGLIGQEILSAGEKVGLKGLCFYDAGARSFYTTNRPVNTPQDLKGMKIRVQQSHIAVEMMRAMGASPTPIDWGELYTSLQQGVVDGAENNPPSFYTSLHYEICQYYSMDEHTMQPDVILISTAVWKDMSPDLQHALAAAIAESVPYYEKLWDQKVQQSLIEVEKAGVKIIRPDKQPFIDAVQPLWKQYDGTELETLANRIREVE